jgi:multiple sugar transport system substrate-binding protein
MTGGKRGKLVLAGIVGLAAVMAMTGCGKKDSGAKDDGAAASALSEPVELNFYHNGGIPEDQFNQQFAGYIQEKLPNVTVHFIPKDKNTSLSEMVASGSANIDIFIDSIGQIGLEGSLIDLGLNQDVSDLVKKHNIDLNRFEPTTIEAVKVMGGLYGLPISNSTMVLMYNKDIFDKFGVPYPKDGMTWEELAELSRKLTRFDGGVQYVGYSTSINHFLRMNPLSLANVDPQTKQASLETDSWKKLLQETILNPMQGDGYKSVVENLKKQWYKVPYMDEFSKTKNVAMFSFMYGNYDWLNGMNFDFAALPSFKDKPKVGGQAYPTYMFITSTSQHKDAAMEVIKLFISDDYQMKMSKEGGITILKDEKIKQAFGQETPLKDKNIKNAVFYNAAAPAAPKTKYDTYVEGAIRNQIYPLITGQTDLNTALRTAQEEVNKKIEAAGK